MKMGTGIHHNLLEVNGGSVGIGWDTVAARPCDNCWSASAAVFCKADAAFLCLGCDAGVHGATKHSSRHERVWMCEVCERSPAAVTCKADAAVLCVSCDADIHSANPLASRHERVPVEPFYDAAESVAKVTGINFLIVPSSGHDGKVEEEVATTWLLPNPSENQVKKGGGLPVFDEADPFFEIENGNSIERMVHCAATDGLVPTAGANRSLGKGFDFDFSRSKISPLIYNNNPDQSLSHCVSSSSHDFGVVPDSGNSNKSEASYPSARSVSINTVTDPNNTCGTTAPSNSATRLCGVDRVARVMRYREKRKNRKFKKTIRYASRKAYAEARPRVKGRFVKRSEIAAEAENDPLYRASSDSASLGTEYGVVPSF